MKWQKIVHISGLLMQISDFYLNRKETDFTYPLTSLWYVCHEYWRWRLFNIEWLLKIYQSCLVAFLTFASKICGPSYAANKPYLWKQFPISDLNNKNKNNKKTTKQWKLKRPPSGRGLIIKTFSNTPSTYGRKRCRLSLW